GWYGPSEAPSSGRSFRSPIPLLDDHDPPADSSNAGARDPGAQPGQQRSRSTACRPFAPEAEAHDTLAADEIAVRPLSAAGESPAGLAEGHGQIPAAAIRQARGAGQELHGVGGDAARA